MSAINCITAKAASGLVSKARGKAASDRIKEIREALEAGGEPPGSASSMAEAQYGVELKATTARQKWRMINNVRVRKQLTAAVNKTAPDKLGGMAIKMVDDLDFDARSIHKSLTGRMGAFLEKMRPDILGRVRNPAMWNDILKGVHGEAVASPEAKAMADAIKDATEWARKKLNSYGYSIGKLDGWGLPHSHNAFSIGNATLSKWMPEIDGMLDWERMINPKTGMEYGVKPSQAYREEYLTAVYKSIVYGRDSKNPQWGVTAAGNVLERPRELKFHNSDTWMKYNAKYGSADPHSTLLMHLDQMSRHIAIAKQFGPTPETAMDYLGDLVAQKASQADAGLKSATKAQGSVTFARGMLRVMEGGIGPNGYWGALSARFFSTTRKVMTAALLDRAVIISVPSDLNSSRIAAQAIGANPANALTTYVNLLNDAVKGGGATRDDLLRNQHVLDSFANPGVTSSRFQAEYPAAAFAEILSNASMKIQGLTAHTDALRESMRWMMAGEFASNMSKGFADLNPGFRKLMQDSNVTEADWDTFRTTGGLFTAQNGATFLSPLMWHKTTTLAPAAADDLFLKMQGVVERLAELAVPTRSLIAQGAMNPVAMGLAPGGAAYELIKSAGMFKSFVGAFVVNQSRIIGMKQGGAAKTLYALELIATSTLVGALAMQVGDMLLGRDPQPMDSVDFWTRAMLRGGGLGPVGDLLNAGQTSWGGGLPGYIAGPVPALAQDVFTLTFGNLATAFSQAINGDSIDVDLMGDLIKFQKRYTPMAQTPLALGGLGFDRLISDQLLAVLDPEAIDALRKNDQRRQNLNGNAAYWMPGSPLPTRAPDLSALTGG